MFKLGLNDGRIINVDEEFVDECINNLPHSPEWVDECLDIIRELVLKRQYNEARIAMREFGNELGA